MNFLKKGVRNKLYSGLKEIQFNKPEKTGFFKTYVSTSWQIEVAERFALNEASKGMLMCLSYDVVKTFPNASVGWLSPFGEEAEILFARSTDILAFPAPKWKGKVHGKCLPSGFMQYVDFTPAAKPLVVEKSATHTLDGTKAIPLAISN